MANPTPLLHQRVSEFLTQVMGGDEVAARRLYLTAFAEDPAGDYDRDTRARMWAGAPAGQYLRRPMTRNVHDEDNIYMVVSTFKPDETGKVRRRQAAFDRGWFIMIDDVGDGPSAKVDPLLISLEPTWAVETSPRNYQLWYRIDPPITDGALLNRMIDQLISKGLAKDNDPGMKGCTRYGRLPFGVNSKAKYKAGEHPQGFNVRLGAAMSDFSRTYSAERFAAAWGIESALSPTPADLVTAPALSDAPGAAEFNEELVQKLGMLGYGPQEKNGTSGIYVLSVCPFFEKHGAGAGRDGAAVFLVGARDGGEVYTRGAFRCHHGHGAEDRWPELLEHLGLTAAFRQMEARATFEPVDIGEVKLESAQIGEDDPGMPIEEVIKRYNITTLEDMLARFAFTEHGGNVVDISRPKLSMSLSTFKAATAAILLPNPVTGNPMPMARAWLQHPKRQTVMTTTFYPGKPERCQAVEEGAGYDAINIWRPVPHVAPKGWSHKVGPFLDHLTYLVPVEKERERFLDWLAHIEQYPADRPHSHYLMVATTQGIGRSYIGSVLARVWPGFTALNFDLVQMLTSGFSGRLSGKLLAVVDEIAEGGKGGDRWAHAETMKSLLSSETIGINVKYGAQRVERNCIRFLMFSNHMSAIPLDATDRRWYIIRNPPAPMSASYYVNLYGLLRDHNYIASVRELLRQRDLDGYNPHELPPMNTAKADMVAASQTDDEQRYEELLENYPHDLIFSSDLFDAVFEAGGGLALVADPERASRYSNRLRHIIHRHGGGAYRNRVTFEPSANSPGRAEQHRVTILRQYSYWADKGASAIREELRAIADRIAAAGKPT
jgi:hypothetical protein